MLGAPTVRTGPPRPHNHPCPGMGQPRGHIITKSDELESPVQNGKVVAESWEREVASCNPSRQSMGGREGTAPSHLPPPGQLPQNFPLPGEGARLIRSRPFDPSPRPWHRLGSSPAFVEMWPRRESSSFLSAAFLFFPFPSPKRALIKRKQHIHPGNKSTINARHL